MGNKQIQTEFYMRRGNVAYFRNEYGKHTMHQCTPEYISRFVYGDKYDFKIMALVRDNGDGTYSNIISLD